MQIKMLINEEQFKPKRGNSDAAGIDIYAVDIKPKTNNVVCVHTGIAIKPDDGCYVELVPRSSLYKAGFMLVNSVGIIDPDYRGEILLYLYNFAPSSQTIKGTRIAQMIQHRIVGHDITFVDELDETERGAGGFGSTGLE